MRTLYQHSARRSSVTHKYVAAVTARGAEVRTLDEFFNRMIVVDRRVAVIPNREESRVAVVVREPAVVAYLVDVFERSWERGRPFTNRETSLLKDIAAEQRAMTMRMLIEGHSDPVSAKRLGVSPRTYAGYVADLKTEYDAETRFQLGYTMGRMGVSGPGGHRGRPGGVTTDLVSPLTPPAPSSDVPCAPEEMSRGQRPGVTALVLLRRAWGVGARTRQVGGKSGPRLKILGAVSHPSWVSRLTGRSRVVVVGVGGYGGRADQAGGQCRGPDHDGDPAHEVLHSFPHLGLREPTEWPASGSLSAGSVQGVSPLMPHKIALQKHAVRCVLDRTPIGHARNWVMSLAGAAGTPVTPLAKHAICINCIKLTGPA